MLGQGVEARFFAGLRMPRVALVGETDVLPKVDYGGGSRLTSVTSGGGVQLTFPVDHRLAFRLLVASSYRANDFEGPRDFLDTGRSGGDPFDQLLDHQLRAGARYQFADDWATTLGGYLTSRYEEGARFEQGLVGGAFGTLTWVWRDRLALTAGLAVGSQMNRTGARVAPLFQVSWRIDDRWTLRSEGLGGRLIGRLDAHWRVSVFSVFRGRLYRIDDRDFRANGGGRVGNGTLRDRQLRVGLGVRFRPSRHWRILAESGAVPWQQYRVADPDAHGFDRATANRAAWFGTLRAEYAF